MAATSSVHDDFAFLTPDIIYDVLQTAHFDRLRRKSTFCSLQQSLDFGRWGEVAARFNDCVVIDSKTKQSNAFGQYEECTPGDVHFVNRFVVSLFDHLAEHVELATRAYEFLELKSYSFSNIVPSSAIVKQLMANLGTRFTAITWWQSSGPIEGDGIDFLKRQLRSPYLRKLETDHPVLTSADFTDLLVEFVRKKRFQSLNLIPTVLSTGALDGKVFHALYEAWLQRKQIEHLDSLIFAPISTEDLDKLTASISNFSWRQNDSETPCSNITMHPTADHYEMLMWYSVTRGRTALRMHFFQSYQEELDSCNDGTDAESREAVYRSRFEPPSQAGRQRLERHFVGVQGRNRQQDCEPSLRKPHTPYRSDEDINRLRNALFTQWTKIKRRQQ